MSVVIADQRQKAQPHTKFKQSWDYIHGKNMEIMLKAPRIMTKAPRIMLEPLRIMANAPRIMAKAPRIMLEPLRIIAKAPRNNARTTAYRQNAVWSLTPAMAFHKRKPKMKDDHIACLPYACLLGKNSLPARKQCIVVGRNDRDFICIYTRVPAM
jgi:hypothetical protein